MSDPTSSLTVSKKRLGKPEVAFGHWTDPTSMAAWFAPDPAMITSAEIDLRIGGNYPISFQPPGEALAMVVGGEYLEVDPPHRLVYSWIWTEESDPDRSDRTIVTVGFKTAGAESTEMVLTHEKISATDARDHHE
jgi:uncharacterized protein YndB with AHSA1/START domain